MPLTDDELGHIAQAREGSQSTRRATVAALEEVLFEPFPLLDHGFLRVIDYMGDDGAVVQAARVSYGRGTRKVSEDRNLIRYLMSHYHSTPFEMASIKLHVKLPIFVARQWIRHRTASVNEYSARYSVLDREFYMPDAEHLAAQSATNRQGRHGRVGPSEAAKILELLREDADRNYDHYLWMLNENADGNQVDQERTGIARELARMNLTLNSYTQWYWKTDLHNLLNFLRLRADSHAQYEIRVYAEVLLNILKLWVPETYSAFIEYRLNSVSLSSSAIGVLRKKIAGVDITQVDSGLSSREWNDLVSRFGL
ncbi:FAD-dependent thymidylate synthase [Methylobacterium goesingense]|uniref:Flavin-dependent thymidylate synthase n=1 Tax=Methylobacterium goesingense TaxID=243690 RepID=A0ABV2L9Q7_9HYPH|nr:FAD-dependent thymidylate synthase [Methylobacterium goesingense]GJD75130.1 Flavin-dependent thymidylate synthase [Methylobacterium goesingense]